MPRKGYQPKGLFTRKKILRHTCPICKLIGRDDPTYMTSVYNAIECPEHQTLGKRIRSRKRARVNRYPAGTPHCIWCGQRQQPGHACADPLCPTTNIDDYFMDAVEVVATNEPDGPTPILAYRLQTAPPAQLARLLGRILSGAAVMVKTTSQSMAATLTHYVTRRSHRQFKARGGKNHYEYIDRSSEERKEE